MAFSSGGDGPIVEPNIIPLADVLLVLLIIFMVTAPPLTYPVDIDLPQPSNRPPPERVDPPPPIRLRIDSTGAVYWNDNPTPTQSLRSLMTAEIERDPVNQPTLEIDVSEEAEYGVLAKVLAEAKNANMQRIGFLRR